MSALSDYNPLKAIWLPEAEIEGPRGIIVIVGPNSSGKTLFLQDIEKYLLTGVPTFIVCQGIASQRPANYKAFVDELLAKNLHFPRKPIGEQAPADEISPPHLRGRKLPQPWSLR